jgi:cell division protein ZapA (FtsZ GTPase activity inhibitor)
LKCPKCSAENADGKNFCTDCGTLLNLQLQLLVDSQVREYVQEHLKDQNVIEIETTERIAARLLKWAKLYYAFPAAALVIILALFGISDYSDFHKTIRRATDELRPKLEQAISESDAAHNKALEAEAKSDEAVKSIGGATAKMNAQLSSAQQLSNRVSGLESQNASQITSASRHIEERVTDLDKKVETANKEIAVQQGKLTSTNELVTAMFSKGQTEVFPTTLGNTATYAIYPLSPVQNGAQQGAMVYMLLKSAPIYQTVELQFHVATQPKYSYALRGNVLTFEWGDPAENLKQHPFVVSYVPDPTFHGVIYSALSVKDGHVFADGVQISP